MISPILGRAWNLIPGPSVFAFARSGRAISLSSIWRAALWVQSCLSAHSPQKPKASAPTTMRTRPRAFCKRIDTVARFAAEPCTGSSNHNREIQCQVAAEPENYPQFLEVSAVVQVEGH